VRPTNGRQVHAGRTQFVGGFVEQQTGRHASSTPAVKDNLADPFTKHHTPAHIQKMKPNFLSIPKHLAPTGLHQLVRGCVNSRRVCPPTVRPPSVRQAVLPRTVNPASQAGLTANNKIVIAPNRRSHRVAH
jgi:hypothetical protein